MCIGALRVLSTIVSHARLELWYQLLFIYLCVQEVERILQIFIYNVLNVRCVNGIQ